LTFNTLNSQLSLFIRVTATTCRGSVIVTRR